MKKIFCLIVIVLFSSSNLFSQKTINVKQGEMYSPFVIHISQEALDYVKIINHYKVDNSFVTNSNEVNTTVCEDGNVPLFYYINEVIITDKGLFVFNKEQNFDLWQIFFIRQDSTIKLDSISVLVCGDSEGNIVEVISFYKEKPFTKITVKNGSVELFLFKEKRNRFVKKNPNLFLPQRELIF